MTDNESIIALRKSLNLVIICWCKVNQNKTPYNLRYAELINKLPYKDYTLGNITCVNLYDVDFKYCMSIPVRYVLSCDRLFVDLKNE